MFAYSGTDRRTMCAKGATTIQYSTTNDTSDYEPIGETTHEVRFVAVDTDEWREVTVDDLNVVKVEEPTQEQDEPDTGEKPVYRERPNRRLATITTTMDRPRQLESTYG